VSQLCRLVQNQLLGEKSENDGAKNFVSIIYNFQIAPWRMLKDC